MIGTMTVRDALQEQSKRLRDSESPWLDATLLLAEATGLRREQILASFPDPLEPAHWDTFKSLIDRRAEGYPVAYLTGSKEFYGRPFHVREGILCPRPDTEIIVEEALRLMDTEGVKRVHDLCTGSGCIALTLALERPESVVSASDISETSKEVFEINRKSLEAGELPYTLCSLLDEVEAPLEMIVSNPPYLTTGETDERMEDRWKEPALALDGGDDGLDLIRILIPQAADRLIRGGYLLIEADPRQMESMAALMKEAGFSGIHCVKDLAGHERVILGRRS